MFPVTAAGALGIVDSLHFLHLAQVVTGAPQTPTKINILVVEEISLIEAIDLAECRGPKQQKHASQPIRILACMGTVISPVENAGRFSQKADYRRKLPRAVFASTFGRSNDGGAGSNAIILRSLQQGRKGVAREPDVRIQNAKKRRRRLDERRILVGTVTVRRLIVDGLETVICRVFHLLWNVLCDDDCCYFRALEEIACQIGDRITVPVTDDRGCYHFRSGKLEQKHTSTVVN